MFEILHPENYYSPKFKNYIR